MPLTLVAVTGLPCVGKSAIATALARRIGLFLVELDHLEAPLLRRGIDGDALGWAGYDMVTALAVDNLAIGRSLVLDAVGWSSVVRDRWAAVAADLAAQFRPIEVVCSRIEVHRHRVEQRRRKLPGYPETTWDDIQEAQRRYEPWEANRLVLDTIEPLGGIIDRAVDYVLRS